MSSPAPSFLFALLALLIGADLRAGEGIEFFEKRIRPLLADRCYECHGVKKTKGSLRLDSREAILKGGESGPAIIPGNSEESLLITAIRYHDKELRMPPPRDEISQKLPDAQIAELSAWVNAGALMPAENETFKNRDARSHWAFLPVTKPKVPSIPDAGWARTPIDSFILEKLNAAGLKPAPPADKRTLIRRATFDLTGLPPTAAEVRDFVEDPSPGAFFKVIERLLASPHYGERWARHWLDLARYSDTKGYVYGREERFFVHASAYRDWVIGALNADLPYDRFLLLQLAADQLVPPGSADLAAMGFLTGGRRFLGVTHDIIDDRIDVVTRGTMALTVTCARCHDHKFDPIPTRDYYSLYGIFHNSAQQLVPIDSKHEPGFEAYQKEYALRATRLASTMRTRREECGTRLRDRIGEYLIAQLELEKYPEEGFDQILSPGDLIPASVRRWSDFLQQAGAHPIFAPWNVLQKLPVAEFESRTGAALGSLRVELNPLVAAAFSVPPKSMREVAERYASLFAGLKSAESGDPSIEALRRFLFDPLSPTSVPDTAIVDNELFFPSTVCTELWGLQSELDRWIIRSPAAQPHALILTDREPEPNPRVFKRGSPSRRGEEVPRRFLELIAGTNRQPFQQGSGRLEMARAIADPGNPLTARVMANRVWLHHFGAGLVRTPSDFGLRADPPSHPELLDWLAGQLVENGWSLKALHRLILSSSTYQQSSMPLDRPAATGDPENRLLSHFPRHRLDFEQMRDALLAATAELEYTMGGKPGDLFSPAYRRRSIYGLVDRQFLPGTFRVFDFANPDLHIAQRYETTVPQQALFFLNSGFIAERTKAIIGRPGLSGNDQERIHQLYSLILQREPAPKETTASLSFIASAPADIPAPAATAWSYGWGEYDTIEKRIKTFTALPHFTSTAWQGGPAWPDAQLGWAQLTADGGHAGNDLQHAVIRRWVAPDDLSISIAGTASHDFEPGDGIRVRVVSSRRGELKSAVLHHSSAEMALPAFEVKKGETIDFVTDYLANLNSDMFTWPPVITATDHPLTWDAKKEFRGPSPIPPLSNWEQFAQVLFLSNEFLFVD